MGKTEVDYQRFVGLIEIELRKLIHDVAMAVEAKQSVEITLNVSRDNPDNFMDMNRIITGFSAPGQEIIKWTVEIRR